MARVIQGTASPGFGGLEMVIIEFHEWLLSKNIEAYVLAVENSPLEKHLLARGHQTSTLSVPKTNLKKMIFLRKKLDSPETAMLFHRQHALKHIAFQKFAGKISLLSHTFYSVKKRDLWHRFVFSNVDQWITLTESHKTNLLETTTIAEKKVKVIPNGVSLEKFKPLYKEVPNKETPIEIGVVARLDRQKGQDIALHALKKLITQTDRKWRLHFIGEDTPAETPIQPALVKLATDLGILENVVFDGFQANIPQVIQNLDLIWMPSHKETFGRCVIEGMASGVPVIASNAGGVPDIISDQKNGVLFETKNPQDLYQKTIDLIGNPILFKSIQYKGRQDVEEKYDQEIIWQKLLQAIFPENISLEFKSKFSHSGT